MGDWCKLNYAKTEAQYEERWAMIQEKYREYGVLIHYLQSAQYSQRKDIAAAWTSQYRQALWAYLHFETGMLSPSAKDLPTK